MSEIGSGRGGGPSPEFRARLRSDLMTAAAAQAGEPALRHRVPHRVAVPQTAAIGLVLALAGTGALAYHSVPGDALYPLKRGAESTLLRLSLDDVDRAERKLHAAQERAAEVSALLGSPGRVELVGQTLDDMERTTRSAVSTLSRVPPGDPDAGCLRRFLREQYDTVTLLLPRMDADTQRQAAGYLRYIDGLAAPD